MNHPAVASLLLVAVSVSPSFAARFIAFVPQPAVAGNVSLASERLVSMSPLPPGTDQHWNEYVSAWRDHATNPADVKARNRLGLPADEAVATAVSPGQAMARSLERSFRIAWTAPITIETQHFVILADLPPEDGTAIAVDLERFYAIWTQMFFPLWKDRQSWDRSEATRSTRSPATRSMTATAKMRVVVMRDRSQYESALSAEGAAIAQSTGYYSGPARLTFLLHEARRDRSAWVSEESRATRYHELTHQLLAEATETKLRAMPGERSGFWLAEGIACYMESAVIDEGFATIGGWEASRLQFARHRVLAGGEAASLAQLRTLGRLQFQRHPDLASLYAIAAADCHRMIDQAGGAGLHDVIAQLAKLYQIRITTSGLSGANAAAAESNDLVAYLTLDDDALTPVTRSDLTNLCLTRCRLSPAAIARIVPQQSLQWLDLTALRITTADLTRLCPEANRLKQLSLEATAINDSIAAWVSGATSLEELDLSWTKISDQVLAELPNAAPLETLWLTGSNVSDASIDVIANFKSLRRIDVQRTAVTEAGRARLRSLRPDIALDPLELVNAK